MATPVLNVGPAEYTVTDAKETIAGYCFGEQQVAWRAPQLQVGSLPPPLRRPRWAYRSYDCVLPDPGTALGSTDLLVASGLNGQLEVDTVSSLLALGPVVSRVLEQVDLTLPFWNIPVTDIHPPALPAPGSQSWYLHRAWFLLESAPSVGIAVAHKTLHHKMPAHFPLLDGQTAAALGNRSLWVQIHTDLARQATTWEELEDWFGVLAELNRGVALTRLRLHDILLWLDHVGRRGPARQHGQAFLEGAEYPWAGNA